MNPEFHRQLWLQFSATRLGLLPLLLMACFTAVYLSTQWNPVQAVAIAGAVSFAVLVWGMGTMAAGASVIDEINDRTWDQQRMSAMQPWAMTWGKLAGASAYGWYGGALCLLVAVPFGLASDLRPVVVQSVLAGLLTGVFLQALLIAMNLQLVKVGGKLAHRGGVWALLLILLWGLGPLIGVLRDGDMHWWGLTFDKIDFLLGSLALFTACALVAAWRCMAEVLAVRQLPWAWPTLALAATAYLSGFAPSQRMAFFGVVGLVTCAAFTYFPLLSEPQWRPLWQRVATRLDQGHWRAALLELPRWPSTLLLALPCAVLSSLGLPADAIGPFTADSAITLQPLALVLLMARDCALALFFAFSPKGRRPVLAFAVLLLVLYGLLPWLLSASGSTVLLQLTQPLLATGWLSLVLAAAHLAAALFLLRWRWRATAPAPVHQLRA